MCRLHPFNKAFYLRLLFSKDYRFKDSLINKAIGTKEPLNVSEEEWGIQHPLNVFIERWYLLY